MPARLLAAQGVGALLALALGHTPRVAAQTLGSPTFTTIYDFAGCSGTSRCDGSAPSGLAVGNGGVLYGGYLLGRNLRLRHAVLAGAARRAKRRLGGDCAL
jgi:hypothetical protein